MQDNIERQFCGQRDVVLRCCTSLPFCDVRSTLSRPVKKSDDWPKLASRLAEAFPKADLLDRPLVACQATAVARGVVDASPLPLSMLRKRLAPDARRAPPGAVLFEPHALSRSSHKVDGQRSLTCVAQTNLAPALLVDYLDKLAKLRSMGAYQQHFAKYGLEDADFGVCSLRFVRGRGRVRRAVRVPAGAAAASLLVRKLCVVCELDTLVRTELTSLLASVLQAASSHLPSPLAACSPVWSQGPSASSRDSTHSRSILISARIRSPRPNSHNSLKFCL